MLPGSGVTLLANANQGSLLLSGYSNLTSVQVTESGLTVYDQVRVIGGFRGSVCTLAKEYIDLDVDGVGGLMIGREAVLVSNDGAACLQEVIMTPGFLLVLLVRWNVRHHQAMMMVLPVAGCHLVLCSKIIFISLTHHCKQQQLGREALVLQ